MKPFKSLSLTLAMAAFLASCSVSQNTASLSTIQTSDAAIASTDTLRMKKVSTPVALVQMPEAKAAPVETIDLTSVEAAKTGEAQSAQAIKKPARVKGHIQVKANHKQGNIVSAHAKVKRSSATASYTALTQMQTWALVLIGAGLLFFLLISWLLGVLMMGAGGIMFFVSPRDNSSKPVPKTNPEPEAPVAKQDVVYLKNGSIIRGTITEMQPNSFLKIQTGDGSLFVYRMEEVDKITKD